MTQKERKGKERKKEWMDKQQQMKTISLSLLLQRLASVIPKKERNKRNMQTIIADRKGK